jgi:hypothetical protein
MIVLGGYSRFPIFFSDDRTRVGFDDVDGMLNHYVQTHCRGKFVVLHALQNIQFRSRFVVKHIAFNPDLQTREDVPTNIYTPPEATPDHSLTDVMAIGFRLKGTRNNVFVPLLAHRVLTKREANAILGISEIKQLGIERLRAFLIEIGITATIEQRLARGTIFHLSDPKVRGDYRVLVGPRGQVIQTDFCVHGHRRLYLTELVMFCRESGTINHIGGFDYD